MMSSYLEPAPSLPSELPVNVAIHNMTARDVPHVVALDVDAIPEVLQAVDRFPEVFISSLSVRIVPKPTCRFHFTIINVALARKQDHCPSHESVMILPGSESYVLNRDSRPAPYDGDFALGAVHRHIKPSPFLGSGARVVISYESAMDDSEDESAPDQALATVYLKLVLNYGGRTTLPTFNAQSE
uniref:Uncharacterized protein n=1 Tax=Nanning tick virus 2 TaxID=2972366 RepID=A0A9E8A9F9_9VIRU|nr:MAG: hypothetical protein [Nanning tick virus 2]